MWNNFYLFSLQFTERKSKREMLIKLVFNKYWINGKFIILVYKCCIVGCRSNYTAEEANTVFFFPKGEDKRLIKKLTCTNNLQPQVCYPEFIIFQFNFFSVYTKKITQERNIWRRAIWDIFGWWFSWKTKRYKWKSCPTGILISIERWSC